VTLKYEIRAPERRADNAPLILLLHGRGSNRHDLFSLATHMPPNAIVVAPEAPFPAAPWGYGPGSAWYQFLGGNRPEPHSFSTSLHELETLLGELKVEVGFDKVVMGGFSQGGTISLAYALTHPDELAGVLNFSGFLADHPEVNPRLSASPAPATPIYWAHGKQDPAIPFALAMAGRAKLEAAGYDVEARDYDIGHWIDPHELHAAVEWLDRIVR
jgi:phospholipase/carboxylesterase